MFAKPPAPTDGQRTGGVGQVQGGHCSGRTTTTIGRGVGRQGGRLRRTTSSPAAPSPSTGPAAAPGRRRRGRGHRTETSPPPRDWWPPSAPSHAPPSRANRRGWTAYTATSDDRDDDDDHATTAVVDGHSGGAHGARPRHDVPKSGQTVVQTSARPPDHWRGRLSAQRVAGARHAAQTASAAQVLGGSAVAGVAASARAAGRGHRSDVQNRYAQDARGRHERNEGLTVAAVASTAPADALLVPIIGA